MDQIAVWFASTLGKYVSAKAVVSLCIIGNILTIPFILLFIKRIFKWMKKAHIWENLIVKLEDRVVKKSGSIRKAEFWGLALFVGIPLSGMGAWTGLLIAVLLNIDFEKAVLAELLGIAMVTVLMSILDYGLLVALF